MSETRRNIKERFGGSVLVFKALAHETRLFIVDELSRGERCVCELTEMIGADISTVSNHLSVLRNAGIVTSDKRGQQVFYSLHMPCVLQFFSCVQKAGERPACGCARSKE